MLFALLVLYTQVTYCIVDDDIDDVIDDVGLNNSFVVLLSSSEYCFVNESTIRINESDVNIINSTRDWIMANNKVCLFNVTANGTNCTSNTLKYNYPNTIYKIQALIISVILVSAAIVTLHLLIKDLQTVSGVLIVILCVFIILNFITAMVHISISDHRNSNVCAVICYTGITLYFVYDTTKLSLLIQFAYLMYRSYKVSGSINSYSKKSAVYKYTVLIVLLTVMCSTSVILVDVLTSKTAFRITHGRCMTEIDSSATIITLILVELLILNAFKISFMIAGIVLYYLTARSCCTLPLRDVKIAMVLNCTIGINSGVFGLLCFLHVSGDVNFTITSISVLIEQMFLFLVFFVSNKVLGHLRCKHAEAVTTTTTETP